MKLFSLSWGAELNMGISISRAAIVFYKGKGMVHRNRSLRGLGVTEHSRIWEFRGFKMSAAGRLNYMAQRNART